MRRDNTRLARFALLGLVVVVVVAVAWGLRRPTPRRPPREPVTRAEQSGTTVGDFVYLSFREGERKVELRAHTMRQVGEAQQLQGVRLTLPFVSEGRTHTAVISANEGLYHAQPRKALLKGQVRVRTDDGLELDTERLRYVAEPRTEIRCEGPVAFRRGTSSGTAVGMFYREGSGVQLGSEVKLQLEDAAGPPTEIASGSASASRDEGLVWFERGVTVRQGNRELRAERLHLKLTPDLDAVERAEAMTDVDLRVGAGGMPGAASAGEPVAVEGESRRIRCGRMVMSFREKGVLGEVRAADPASLEVLPGPEGSQERRLITASVLHFGFDEEGRLSGLESESEGPPAPVERRRSVFLSEPQSGSGPRRRVESKRLRARFDAERGGVLGADFEGAVVFSEPGRSGRAEQASFDEAAGAVLLRGGEARLVDEAQGSELRGRQIRIGTRSHDITAREKVRHTVSRKGEAGIGPLGGDEPTVLLCQAFDYVAATKTARYHEQALLRSGRDEIRAPLIEIEEPAEGARRLRAEGGVSSLMHPRPAKGEKKAPAAIETRSRELVYDEKARRIVYTGEVELRQGDILSKSPEAIVLLAADGKTIDRLLAGSPVEVRQGARSARGERGTYTPRDETLVLVSEKAGEKVVLKEVGRRLEGRSLTFQVGSDRIRVDGRDETRTEVVLERREPQKP